MNPTQTAYILIALNIIGFLYGLHYYGDQLAETSPLLWILVIDCPLQALLFAIVLFLAISGKSNDFLTAFTAVGSIKYGIWTMFVILFQADYFLVGSFALMYTALFIAHTGQFLQGIFLAGARRMNVKTAVLLLILFLANEYSDYWIGTHPRIPEQGLQTVMNVTVALSVLSVAFVYLAGKTKLNVFARIKTLKELRSKI